MNNKWEYGDWVFVEMSFVPLSWFATPEEAEIYKVKVIDAEDKLNETSKCIN